MGTTDFRHHLSRQLAFLKRSCDSFDAGFHDEAIRIATVIRVLVHQTKSSTSLLKHLNATTISLLSTAPPTNPNVVMSMGMGTIMMSSDGASYFPSLGDTPFQESIPVSKWWEQEVMIMGSVRLTRRKIVLAAANQDGGAHVDTKLNSEYEALTMPGFAGSICYHGPSSTKEIPLENSHYVCLRQFGYELLNSVELRSKASG
ncbi:hypothetical protein [Aeromonas jandaei]|uniref:hypothetical protein n=1 Tax=Aeromonas jandaei TaxID=650 RepID=UPI0012ECA908|nr:hypothetical protein [Aeromonas jandaei]